MKFPQDETGRLLEEMHEAGINLSEPTLVDFFQLFESESQAREMAEHVSSLGIAEKVKCHPDQTPNVWDVDCTIKLVPSYDNIVAWEKKFEQIADSFDGYNDGWGIMA